LTGKLRIRSTIEPRRPVPDWRLEKSVRGFPFLILPHQDLWIFEVPISLLSTTRFREPTTETVGHYLEILGLTPFRHEYPAQISSGMAQRVARGRARCYNSDIILMDEPLSALDAFTRRTLQQELLHIFQEHRKTMLLVTHDVDEALIMGQRVLVMDRGRIIQDYSVPFPYPRTVGGEPFFRLRESLLQAITGDSH